jgi:hypothetical protein
MVINKSFYVAPANPATPTQNEINKNNEYIAQARDSKRGHVFISELPYPSRFVASRAKHEFLACRLGAVYI